MYYFKLYNNLLLGAERMKNTNTILNLGSLFFILLSSNFFEAAMRFLMVGEVPFADISVSPEGMFLVLLAILFAAILVILPRHVTRKTLDDIKFQTTRLPKRRYTRI